MRRIPQFPDGRRRCNECSPLSSQGADPNTGERNGETALYRALRDNRPEEARALILQGADVNAKVGMYGTTPLLSALIENKTPPDMIPLLLKHGADVNAADNQGTTPLILACSTAPLATVRLFLRYGAKVDVQGERRETPLMAATRNPDAGVVRLLLDHKADVHSQNSEEATPLIVAASYSKAHPATIRLLLAHKSDIDARDKYGDTPLMAACRYAPAPVARLLIDRRADVNVQEPFHETALFLVVLSSMGPQDHKAAEIIPRLLAHGADPHVIANGYTPLQFAQYAKRPDLVALLQKADAKR